MTLKTSFFNKAIYKSTLKRYLWGSVLYFVLLFLSSGFSVLMDIADESITSYYNGFHPADYMLVPVLMMLFVPVVTALLVYRCFHSRHQAIFTFSLPATRSAGVISEFLGGLTLMIAPVVLNGIILLLISKGTYEWYLTEADCFAWMGYNIFGLFIMYSCSVFAVSITGNAFSGVIINILVHCFFPVIVLSFEAMADTFLYGFTYNNALSEFVGENNYVVVLFGFLSEHYISQLTAIKICMYTGASVVLCVLSYVLFLKRKVQSASEVAGFGCLNGIFKYVITFLTALLTFGVCSGDVADNAFGVAVLIILLSLLAYTLSEMVIRRKLNVFYAWKGYVCFGAAFLMIVGMFAYTPFFGYEVRIPATDKVQSISVHNNRIKEVYVSDEELFDSVAEIHSELTEDIPVILNEWQSDFSAEYICITYKLANGKTLNRKYTMDESGFCDIMNRLYENEAYKKAHEPAFLENDEIVYIFVDDEYYTGEKELLLEALRKDIMMLNFESIHQDYLSTQKYDKSHSLVLKFKSDVKHGYDIIEPDIEAYEMCITEDFANTIAHLKESEYINR